MDLFIFLSMKRLDGQIFAVERRQACLSGTNIELLTLNVRRERRESTLEIGLQDCQHSTCKIIERRKKLCDFSREELPHDKGGISYLLKLK